MITLKYNYNFSLYYILLNIIVLPVARNIFGDFRGFRIKIYYIIPRAPKRNRQNDRISILITSVDRSRNTYTLYAQNRNQTVNKLYGVSELWEISMNVFDKYPLKRFTGF